MTISHHFLIVCTYKTYSLAIFVRLTVHALRPPLEGSHGMDLEFANAALTNTSYNS